MPTMWNKELTESAQDYMSRTNLSLKDLDFVQSGGSKLTVDRTIFDMRLEPRSNLNRLIICMTG